MRLEESRDDDSDGLSVGAVYASVALGYNIVFLSCGALNFATRRSSCWELSVTYWAPGAPAPLALRGSRSWIAAATL